MNVETFDQSNDETWPDQRKAVTKTKAKAKTRQLRKNPQRVTGRLLTLGTCEYMVGEVSSVWR